MASRSVAVRSHSSAELEFTQLIFNEIKQTENDIKQEKRWLEEYVKEIDSIWKREKENREMFEKVKKEVRNELYKAFYVEVQHISTEDYQARFKILVERLSANQIMSLPDSNWLGVIQKCKEVFSLKMEASKAIHQSRIEKLIPPVVERRKEVELMIRLAEEDRRDREVRMRGEMDKLRLMAETHFRQQEVYLRLMTGSNGSSPSFQPISSGLQAPKIAPPSNPMQVISRP